MLFVSFHFPIYSQEICPNSNEIKNYKNTMNAIISDDEIANKMQELTDTQNEYSQIRSQYDECIIENSNPINGLLNLGVGCNSLAIKVNQLADKKASMTSDLKLRLNILLSFKQNTKDRWPRCDSLF